MKRRRTTEEFIELSKKVHGSKYNYSKVNYVFNKEKVCIVCPIHGEFWQTPNSHLSGKGCPKCSGKNKTTEEFINQANVVHNNKYDYSRTEYTNSSTKVCVMCPKHGEFWVTPNSHLKGCGCRECDNERKKKVKYNTEQIIRRFMAIHGDYFDYSKFKYSGITNKSIIICPKHGEFLQSPHDHLKGAGCPMCNQSTLEKEIKEALIENNITFEEQKTFDWLLYKGHQHLDFYIPKYKCAIECQGIQHFKPTPFFTKSYDTAKTGFEEINRRDLNKKKLCEENNIKVIYFSHKNLFIENKSNITDIFDNTNNVIKEILKYEQKSS